MVSQDLSRTSLEHSLTPTVLCEGKTVDIQNFNYIIQLLHILFYDKNQYKFNLMALKQIIFKMLIGFIAN